MIAILLQDINAREMKMYVHTEISKYAASGNGVLAVWREKLFSDHALEDEV